MSACAIVCVLVATAAGPSPAAEPPRFTEEREAAALHFVKKHYPELAPVLADLKKGNRAAYEQQVRETFKVSELLADLRDDATRHDLELKVWKTENKALLLVAKLAALKVADRTGVEAELRVLAKELVGLEVESLEHQAAVLERELAGAKDDLAKARENFDRNVRDKFDGLIEKAKKRRGS